MCRYFLSHLNLISMFDGANTAWGACYNDVSRFHCEISGNKGNELRNAEDHVFCIGFLHNFTIEAATDIQALRISNFFRRNDYRPNGAKCIQRLSPEPSRLVGSLQVPLADIVKAGKASDLIQCFTLINIFYPVFYNDGKFCFIIGTTVFKSIIISVRFRDAQNVSSLSLILHVPHRSLD